MELELGLEIAAGVGLVILGFLLGRLSARPDRKLGARVRELEEVLFEEREQRAGYEDSVGKHFARTSELFRDLTGQYTSLYAHLAEGARELCADRDLALGRGFEGELLPPGLGVEGGPGAQAPEPPELVDTGPEEPAPEAAEGAPILEGAPDAGDQAASAEAGPEAATDAAAEREPGAPRREPTGPTVAASPGEAEPPADTPPGEAPSEATSAGAATAERRDAAD